MMYSNMQQSVTCEAINSLRVSAFTFYETYPPLQNQWELMTREQSSSLALQTVVNCLQSIYENNCLTYPQKIPENLVFHEGYGLCLVAQPKLTSLKMDHYYDDEELQDSHSRLRKVEFVLDVIRKGLESGTKATKRNIYYQNVNNFSAQPELDNIVSLIVSALQVPRLFLGVSATSKGLVAGNLRFTSEDDIWIDCSLTSTGETVPQGVDLMNVMETDADFVLVVEKDTVFQRLLDEGVLGGVLGKVIVVTGKGMPDLATRQLVFKLATNFRLPVLMLTDCDPFGFEIMLTYRFGSTAMAYCPEMVAVPSLWWLGILPRDLTNLPTESARVLSPADTKKIQDISGRPYVRNFSTLHSELNAMWQMGIKMEIEQVSQGPGYLTHSYLPHKINTGGFI